MNKSFDYNLTKFLVAVMDTKSMTAAADLLGLAPSGVSHAISKLREYFHDPLFIKVKGGVQPTPLALTLYERFAPLVAVIESTKNINTTSLLNEKRSYHLRTSSIVEYWLSYYALKNGILTPKSSLNFVDSNVDNETRINMLRRREIDLDIGTALNRDSNIYSKHLFDVEAVMLCRNDHPRIGDEITFEEYRKENYVTWSPIKHNAELSQSLEYFLDSQSINTLISSCSYLNLILNVTHSDLVIIIPKFFVPLVMKQFPLKEVRADFIKIRKYSMYVYFHKSEKNNIFINQLINLFNK